VCGTNCAVVVEAAEMKPETGKEKMLSSAAVVYFGFPLEK